MRHGPGRLTTMSTTDGNHWGAMCAEYLDVPGLPPLTGSRILDWYDGPRSFRAESADGSVWLCAQVDEQVTPPGVEWTRFVDCYAYARHDAATADDILNNRRPYRDIYTAAREIYRVEVTWLSAGGPRLAGVPTSTSAPSTPETVADGWLPPADHYFRIDLPPSPVAA